MSIRILFFVCLFLVAGCASRSPQSSFFVLSPVVEGGGAAAAGITLGVGPVRLPDYLDRSQLVRRSQGSRLEVDEFNRWGGDLARNIQDVLAQNLARLLGSPGVLTYPWDGVGIDRQLTLDIRRFEAGPGREVVLDLQWRLLDARRRTLVALANEHIVVPVADDTPAAMVRAQNAALAELSRRLARLVNGR